MFRLAAIAAEKIAAQVQPVLHHLEADFVSGLGQLNSLRSGGLSVVFAVNGPEIDQEQNYHHQQHGPETAVKFATNRHPVPPA